MPRWAHTYARTYLGIKSVLACSFKGREKMLETSLVKVSPETHVDGGGSSLTPTWLSEVLFSLPMATQCCVRAPSVPQDFIRGDWKTKVYTHLYNRRRPKAFLSAHLPRCKSQVMGNVYLCSHTMGKGFGKVFFCSVPLRLLSQSVLVLLFPTPRVGRLF